MKFDALGPLIVASENGQVVISPAPRRLLAGLLLGHDVPVSSERLIDWVWGDDPPATARNTLQAHVSSLRRSLPGVIHRSNGGYAVDLTDHEVAHFEFERRATDCAHLFSVGEYRPAIEHARCALTMWRGDPYHELVEVDAARAEAGRLHQLLVSIQVTLARLLIATGDLGEAIGFLSARVAENPLHEAFWEQLIHAYYLDGRQADALRTYAKASRVLGEELGIEPGTRLRELEERILLQDPILDVERRSSIPTNLPAPDNSFIGRVLEMRRIVELLDTSRLVTVVGGPGLGKTRLAIEAGWQALDRFPGGVWLVRLVGASDASDVSATIASSTRVLNGVEELEELAVALSSRPALVILDNCEHLLGPVRRFLASAGGKLRVLTTSRSPVGIAGESVLRLGPLDDAQSPLAPLPNEAMRLFVDRVAAFGVSADSLRQSHLVEICRRAAGIPLALELMASWAPAISLSEIVELTLAGPAHELAPATPHHGSLAQAIEWSVDRLDHRGQGAFIGASVFAASFDVDAFHAVCLPDSDRAVAARQVVSLVEASLLNVEYPGEGLVRYRMLEPLREYATTVMAGPDPSTRDRHASWFGAKAIDRAPDAEGQGEAEWFGALDREMADHRQALRHLIDTGRHRPAAAIATALQRYWFARYLSWEAHRWLEEALTGQLDGESRLGALSAAGWAAYSTASYTRAEDHYEEALLLARERSDHLAEGLALYGLGRVHLPRRFRDGVDLLNQALDRFEVAGATAWAAECRLCLGMRASKAGECSTARLWLEEAVAELERHGQWMLVSVGYRYLSLAAWYEGDEGSARFFLSRAESAANSTDDRRAIGGTLIQRALIEGRWGVPAAAAAAIVHALEPIPPGNDIDNCLIFFGAFPALLATGQHELARRVIGHIDRVYDQYGWTPLDIQMPVAAEFRAVINGRLTTVDDYAPPVTSAEMAEELTQGLQQISLGGPAPTVPTV